MLIGPHCWESLVEQFAETTARTRRRGCSKKNCAARVLCCSRSPLPVGTGPRGGPRAICPESRRPSNENLASAFAGRRCARSPRDSIVIVASGRSPATRWPLPSRSSPGAARLSFYDSISPIVDADTIDPSIVFAASRYGKGMEKRPDASGSEEEDGDYLNCPLSEEQYQRFYEALVGAESVLPARVRGLELL